MLTGEDMAFNVNVAYRKLVNSEPRLAADFHTWQSSVPFVYTYLLSTVDGKPIYAGETYGKTRGRRLYNHLVRGDRLTNFGKTYQKKHGLTPEETHRKIRKLHVRWFEGPLADCKQLQNLIIENDAPVCNKRKW